MKIFPRFALAAVLAVAVLLIHMPRSAAIISMSWRLESMVDANSGEKICRVISLGDDVTARLNENPDGVEAAWSVMVGVDNQPGSVRYLRINRKIFQTAEPSFVGDDAADIVALLKDPGDFVYEWIKGPEETKRGALYSIGDFAAAIPFHKLTILNKPL